MGKFFTRAISYHKEFNGHSEGEMLRLNHFAGTWPLWENNKTQAFMFGGNQILLITCPRPSLQQHMMVAASWSGGGVLVAGTGKLVRVKGKSHGALQ